MFLLNPFTGLLDLVSVKKSCIQYAQFPQFVRVLSDSRLLIESGGAVRIFAQRFVGPFGFVVNNNITIQAGSKLLIENGSSGTALGG